MASSREIDSIAPIRGAGGETAVTERVVSQLLTELDGMENMHGVIVLAATNRPETLDAALLRAGRFDRQVLVDKPDFAGRLAILKVHSKGVKLADTIDMEVIAKQTAGMAGADLANIINEAALLSGRRNKKTITQEELLEAIERAFVGLERKNRKSLCSGRKRSRHRRQSQQSLRPATNAGTHAKVERFCRA